MTSLGPQVPIRSLRKAYGLTLAGLAERIEPYLGKPVDQNSLSNIERGNKAGSDALMNAWARALGLNPLDVAQSDHHDETESVA